MKIRNMRWGYDGGGMACGPVEGNTLVEICVTDDEGGIFFVCDSRMSDFEKIEVSPMPLFDIMMYMMRSDVDFDSALEKCDTNAIETYDYDIHEAPENDLAKSRFAKVIHLVRLAMQEYYGKDNEITDAKTARMFIGPYVEGNFDEMELPELELLDD